MKETTGPSIGQDGLEQILERAQALYTTVGDLAYSVLRQAILSGVLPPGQHLRQDALAERLGMSRIPVRSALFQLESDGLVKLRPHRGALVTILTASQVREIYETRVLLETHALRRAIKTMTPERLARLRQLAVRLDDEQPGEAFLETRVAFYSELYDEENNPLQVDLIQRLRSDVGRYWLRRRVIGHSHEPSHGQLLDYMSRGETDAAVLWLEGHLRSVCDEVIQMVEKRAAEADGEPDAMV